MEVAEYQYNGAVMDPSVVKRWRALSLFALGAFLGLSAVVFATGLLPGDVLIRAEVLEGRGSLWHSLARWANYGGTWMVLLPAMLLLFWLSPAARRHWWLWCGVMIASGAVEHLFKLLVGRPRPRGTALGFPSGHTQAAAAFAVLLIYLISREPLGRTQRLALQALAVALIISVGFARIMLNAHWPSDVLGGFLLGGGFAAAGAWWDAAQVPARPEAGRVADNAIRIGG